MFRATGTQEWFERAVIKYFTLIISETTAPFNKRCTELKCGITNDFKKKSL